MPKAAVYIISYGANEKDDFQALAGESELRDPDVDRWLWHELHTLLQKQQWAPEQVVYLSQKIQTSRSDYFLVCRIVSRLSNLRQRPYREMIAVYVDEAAVIDDDLECLWAGIPWQRLLDERVGSVELRGMRPASPEVMSVLRDQINRLYSSGTPIVCERNHSTLTSPCILYTVLSALPPETRKTSRVVTGASSDWKAFSDFEVQVNGTDKLTPFDPDSKSFKAYQRSKDASLLLQHVPDSYLELRSIKTLLQTLDHTVKAMGHSTQDPRLLTQLLESTRTQLGQVNEGFDKELAGTQNRRPLDSATANHLSTQWSARLKWLQSECDRVASAARILPVPVPAVTETDVKRIVNWLNDDLRESVMREMAARITRLHQDEPAPIRREEITNHAPHSSTPSPTSKESPKKGQRRRPAFAMPHLERAHIFLVAVFLSLALLVGATYIYRRMVKTDPEDAKEPTTKKATQKKNEVAGPESSKRMPDPKSSGAKQKDAEGKTEGKKSSDKDSDRKASSPNGNKGGSDEGSDSGND